LADTANQPEVRLNSKSAAADYYNYYKRHSADEILRSRNFVGDEKALAIALIPTKKPWRVLRKKG